MDKEILAKIEAVEKRVKRIERMIQYYLRYNHAVVAGEKPEVDGCAVQLSKEQQQEYADLVYGNAKETKTHY